jgi:hypothetical protein
MRIMAKEIVPLPVGKIPTTNPNDYGAAMSGCQTICTTNYADADTIKNLFAEFQPPYSPAQARKILCPPANIVLCCHVACHHALSLGIE